jgi:hypothetical protein
MYPGPNGAAENHKRGYCSDGARQTLKPSKQNKDPPKPNKSLSHSVPEWPQPQGIFTEGTYFHPLEFLANFREIYERVVIEKVSGKAAMEHEAFASLLMARTLVLSDGCVLFKLFDLTCPASTPEDLFIIREGDKYLRIDCLREPPTTLTPSY